MSITVHLSKPITTHQGPKSEIELNEPLARAFVRFGEPFNIVAKNGSAEIIYDNVAMMGFLVDMTGVDQVILEGLPAKDYLLLRAKATEVITGVAGTDNPTEV